MRASLFVVLAACGRIGFDSSARPAPADAAAGDAVSPYHDVTQPALWSTFDLMTVGRGTYATAVFDGRYLYPIPYTGSLFALRYDTRAPFADAASWSGFDISMWNTATRDFSGGGFDGRYIYYVANQSSVFVRYDSQGSFTDPASWSSFDLTNVVPGAGGYGGAIFDGRFLVLVPLNASPPLRYDTSAPFPTSQSWVSLPLSAAAMGAGNYWGGTFDGQAMYFAPHGSSTVARGDALGGFSTGANAATFDMSSLGPAVIGFDGAAFDGTYLYLAENDNDVQGMVARYDTRASFTAATSWQEFATKTIAGTDVDFVGAVFDGRFIYCVPGIFALLARYDTAMPFGDAAAWTIADPKNLGIPAQRYIGGAFDGSYVYLIGGTTIARFDARSPASLPLHPGYSPF